MANDNQPIPAQPVVELNEWGELDIDALQGGDLITFIKYAGMQEHDFVAPRWLAAGPGGESSDDVRGKLPVSEKDLVTGLPVRISNDKLKKAEGGWAFYSYTVNDSQESQRLFCYLGLRDRSVNEPLPPVLCAQAHNLLIRPNQLAAEGATFIVAPYQAMQVGDLITFNLVGLDDTGEEDSISASLSVAAEHFGSTPLAFTVRRNFFTMLEPGSARATYSVKLVEGPTIAAQVQTFTLDSGADWPDHLPVPVIEGLGEGEELDPVKVREGFAIRVDAYPAMDVGDRVILYWNSPVADRIEALRVDPSTLAKGSITFYMPGEVALANEGATVTIRYLYARLGRSLLSEPLQAKVKAVRKLALPSIDDVIPEEESGLGSMEATDAVGGVYVEIPDVLKPGESAEVHWWGHPGGGRVVVTESTPAHPRRFLIPDAFVPANMGRGQADESRRFEVSYVLKPGGERSEAYGLRILPIARRHYPTLVCDEGAVVSLARVPANGVGLTLGSWIFIAAGQLLTISVTGVATATDGEFSKVLRDGQQVTVEEAAEGVKLRLPREVLAQLKLNETFTLAARCSFDGGELFVPFNGSSVRLTA